MLDLESLDTDPCIDTVKALPYDGASHQIHHSRVSAKFGDKAQTDLEAIVLRHFVDEDTPHYKFGVEFDPAQLDQLIDGLEILRMRHLRGD